MHETDSHPPLHPHRGRRPHAAPAQSGEQRHRQEDRASHRRAPRRSGRAPARSPRADGARARTPAGRSHRPRLRRQLFDALPDTQRGTVSLEGGLIKIDVREPRRELAAALRELRRARQLVITDPDILGGDPVFRGTRVPVHAIASQLVDGEPEADLRKSYPRLTTEMLRLAPLYAAAYPARGRPRAQPWHRGAPVRRMRRKLAAIEAG